MGSWNEGPIRALGPNGTPSAARSRSSRRWRASGNRPGAAVAAPNLCPAGKAKGIPFPERVRRGTAGTAPPEKPEGVRGARETDDDRGRCDR